MFVLSFPVSALSNDASFSLLLSVLLICTKESYEWMTYKQTKEGIEWKNEKKKKL
jgi:hypothetical protein